MAGDTTSGGGAVGLGKWTGSYFWYVWMMPPGGGEFINRFLPSSPRMPLPNSFYQAAASRETGRANGVSRGLSQVHRQPRTRAASRLGPALASRCMQHRHYHRREALGA